MKIAYAALIGILAVGATAPVLARGDGYNRSQEFVKRFKENQKKIHGKEKQAAQVESQKNGSTKKDTAQDKSTANEG
ncbi:hypothetical protein [Aquipseudomonas ullengensis]|uniref:Uncharacterized protein n=1 Tax=Aquipseudomonas ullengensis TaxID=2759166 RepID=A0A7W4LNT7_9GAMM|nr:hypothetical protein [Pseudomonas ullengensis]MBB2496477.1 hypothetical protein [Pseudomonas ullengensis]